MQCLRVFVPAAIVLLHRQMTKDTAGPTNNIFRLCLVCTGATLGILYVNILGEGVEIDRTFVEPGKNMYTIMCYIVYL